MGPLSNLIYNLTYLIIAGGVRAFGVIDADKEMDRPDARGIRDIAGGVRTEKVGSS
ncbi:MAG: hypothetical protein NT061_06795 [Spirochaetes bacterium]|nr:hypothetical protein [Spirochaetota bacterium]